MPRNRQTLIACALAWACLTALGCGGPSDEQLFQTGEDLYRDGKFQEAIPVFKQYLLRHPGHSGAHLYLGGCYQFSDRWSTLAEGEILTALHLFIRDGRKSTIPRFPDEYFGVRCYLDLIKIQYARLTVALNPQTPPQYLASSIEGFKQYVDEALAFAPDNNEIQGIAQSAPEILQLAQQALIQRTHRF